MKTGDTGATKMKLVTFEVVCSEICAHRLRKGSHGWQFQCLSLWLGPEAFRQYVDLVETYWVTPKLRNVALPLLLDALRGPARPVVVDIRPGIDEIIQEAKHAVAGLDVLWMLPGGSAVRTAGPGLAAVGACTMRKAFEN